MATIKQCPSCKASLEGGLIYDHFMEQYKDDKKALETAKMYGATRTTGRWGKALGIYNIGTDRTESWKCPYCSHQWGRF